MGRLLLQWRALVVILILCIPISCGNPPTSPTTATATVPPVIVNPTVSLPPITPPALVPPPMQTDIVFLVDQSSSVRSCDSAGQRLALVSFFVKLFGVMAKSGHYLTATKISIINFANGVDPILSSSPAQGLLDGKLFDQISNPNSSLDTNDTNYSAALEHAEQIGQGNPNKFIILITDGSFLDRNSSVDSVEQSQTDGVIRRMNSEGWKDLVVFVCNQWDSFNFWDDLSDNLFVTFAAEEEGANGIYRPMASMRDVVNVVLDFLKRSASSQNIFPDERYRGWIDPNGKQQIFVPGDATSLEAEVIAFQDWKQPYSPYFLKSPFFQYPRIPFLWEWTSGPNDLAPLPGCAERVLTLQNASDQSAFYYYEGGQPQFAVSDNFLMYDAGDDSAAPLLIQGDKDPSITIAPKFTSPSAPFGECFDVDVVVWKTNHGVRNHGVRLPSQSFNNLPQWKVSISSLPLESSIYSQTLTFDIRVGLKNPGDMATIASEHLTVEFQPELKSASITWKCLEAKENDCKESEHVYLRDELRIDLKYKFHWDLQGYAPEISIEPIGKPNPHHCVQIPVGSPSIRLEDLQSVMKLSDDRPTPNQFSKTLEQAMLFPNVFHSILHECHYGLLVQWPTSPNWPSYHLPLPQDVTDSAEILIYP